MTNLEGFSFTNPHAHDAAEADAWQSLTAQQQRLCCIAKMKPTAMLKEVVDDAIRARAMRGQK